jgi:hypothetical protein
MAGEGSREPCRSMSGSAPAPATMRRDDRDDAGRIAMTTIEIHYCHV